jgi:uncharacterized protein DUF3179
LNRRIAWFVLVVLASLSLALVALPVWIIQPFKTQTQQGLAWSFAMRRWATFATPVALVLAFALVLWLWRGPRRWWRKALLIVVLIPMLTAVWFSRQNHFEWMFNPLLNPAYAKTSDAGFVADSDVVIAVVNNGEAAAYPVRLMAYHHLVHDVVGDTPIVATY